MPEITMYIARKTYTVEVPDDEGAEEAQEETGQAEEAAGEEEGQ